MHQQAENFRTEHMFELHNVCLCFSIFLDCSQQDFSEEQARELAIAKIKVLLQSDDITGVSARKIADSKEIVGATLYPMLLENDELDSEQLEWVDYYEHELKS